MLVVCMLIAKSLLSLNLVLAYQNFTILSNNSTWGKIAAFSRHLVTMFQMMQPWGTGLRSALRRFWTRHKSLQNQRKCSIPTLRMQFCLKQSTSLSTWTVTLTCWCEHATSLASSCSTVRLTCGMLPPFSSLSLSALHRRISNAARIVNNY